MQWILNQPGGCHVRGDPGNEFSRVVRHLPVNMNELMVMANLVMTCKYKHDVRSHLCNLCLTLP